MLGDARQDSSCSTHGYSHAEYGVSSSDPYVPGPADRKRKKVKASDWEQTEAAERGPVDLELIPSYGGHVAGRICRGQDRGLLKCRSRYMALTGFNALELHVVATSRKTSQSHQGLWFRA
ncbi:hypothetical protein M9H77_24333 [Catharanthus roseus]|uniref:Uncharacterized protein n=1 Tax=Catharanthus roseus TaxID=4058 RepID=A0ACC0AXC5_CATRO|nr:hypothetical protein M9H77_24333 [Catharanthus roseus]